MENPAEWSSDFNDFIASCLVKDPEARPSASDLLEHPFIKNATSKEVLVKLVAETMAAIEEAGGRAQALGMDSDDDEDDSDTRGKASKSKKLAGYRSSGDEDDDDDDSFSYGTTNFGSGGTSNFRGGGDDSDDEQPAYMAHMRRNDPKEEEKEEAKVPSPAEDAPANNPLAKFSTEDLKRIKNELEAEKQRKIAEIKSKFAALMLPVE